MQRIEEICQKHKLILVEDCCEATGAAYDGKPVGNFGIMGTFSFYYAHHITTGEGGLVTTNDAKLAEILRLHRAHGRTSELKNPCGLCAANIHALLSLLNFFLIMR